MTGQPVPNSQPYMPYLLSEYIDYHLSPETMTPPPNAPLILNGGDGDIGGWGSNVTAQLGAKAQLHCLVHNRQDKTVRRQRAK